MNSKPNMATVGHTRMHSAGSKWSYVTIAL